MNNENLVMNLLEMLIKAESKPLKEDVSKEDGSKSVKPLKSVEPLEDYDFPEVEDVNINNEKLIMTLADMVAKAYAKIPKAGPFIEVGKAYLFRSVTHIELGEVVEVYGDFVKIVKASWIADTGRYHDCLKYGELNEVEPYTEPDVVHLSSLINFTEWKHALPLEQK